jgi:hypothetical protein
MTRSTLFLLALAALAPSTPAQWSTDVFPIARGDFATAASAERAYFAGGVIFTSPGAGVLMSALDIYDAPSRTWSSTSLSIARTGLAATALGDEVLFAGGWIPGGVEDHVDVWNEATGVWTSASLSLARGDLAATSVGPYALFAGGREWGAMSNPLSAVVDIYDSQNGTWSTASLSQARFWIHAVTVGERAYFLGGNTAIGIASDVIDVFDSSTGAWSTASLPTARDGGAATASHGKIYFGGGRDTVGLTASVDIFDVASATWSTTNLSQARSGSVAGAIGSKVIFAGGTVSFPSNSSTVDIYDTVTGNWSSAQLSQARVGSGAATVGNQFLVAGGVLACLSAGSYSNVTDIFSDRAGATTCSPSVPNSSGNAAELVAWGSEVSGGNPLQLLARGLPAGRFGYFLASATQASSTPAGSQGVLCLGAPFAKLIDGVPLARSSAGGWLQTSVATEALPFATPVAILPGETWTFQAWFRDQNPARTTNFTDAVAITFQ